MATMSKKRKAMIAGGVVAGVVVIALVALFGYWYVVDSRNPYGGHNEYGMRDYSPEVQEEAAQGTVAGLNIGNPDNVLLVRPVEGGYWAESGFKTRRWIPVTGESLVLLQALVNGRGPGTVHR